MARATVSATTVASLVEAAPRWWCAVCQREIEDERVALGSHVVNAGTISYRVHQVQRVDRYPVNGSSSQA
jgi:hypothetical protein